MKQEEIKKYLDGRLVKKTSSNPDFKEYWLYCYKKQYVLSPIAKTGLGHGLAKLSLDNCQAIERGYDLDELAKADADLRYNKLRQEELWLTRVTGIHYGFQKALEILGDKKFSENDLKQSLGDVLFNNCQNGIKEGEQQKYIDSIIQSLQQTEWEVQIETNRTFIYDPAMGISQGYNDDILKLDGNDCLIMTLKQN